MKTPFDILGIAENATDEEIKKAYLQKIRQNPPERAPEQFKTIRAAFEAISDRSQRLKYQLFHHEPPSLSALLEYGLKTGTPQRPTEEIFTQVVTESLNRLGKTQN
ncbi:J domain-containing protein [Candidatus Parabeggiatoa sp. HSG14]|uniref:J domain-containing protein n=1 Tax=Candidatus Parabeggiatoa sp. HSG14 TaxID=3055593 RepID=UPI0025A7F96E|nr:J domain-containing protein [Thiotrichales bacterium HSG14]